MAASSTLLATGRSARITGTRATYTATYRVVLDSDTSSPMEAITLGQGAGPNAVPLQFATYSQGAITDPGVFAQDFEVTPETPKEKPNRWLVTVTWRELDPRNHPTDPTTPPVQRVAKFSLEFWNSDSLVSLAYNVDPLLSGATSPWRPANTLGPIVNAANEQFQDAIVDEDRIVILVARKNFATLADVLTLHRNFNRSLNSDTFYGYPPHYCKFIGIELGELITEGAYSYYPGSIKVALAEKEWYLEIVNRGLKVREDPGGPAVNAVDKHGKPVHEPVLLKPDGTRLPEGEVGTAIRYRHKRAVAYTGGSGLGIGGE